MPSLRKKVKDFKIIGSQCGLSREILEDRLTDTISPAMGTVLEIRDEVGMGKTIDVILFINLKIGDKIMLASVTVRFLLTSRA